MKLHSEYQAQGILAVLQSVLVIVGCLMTAALLKARGYPDRFADLPFQLALVRNWGFTLNLIPLGWVMMTIWLERNHRGWFSKRWTVLTGIGLGIALGWYFLVTMARAGSSTIQYGG